MSEDVVNITVEDTGLRVVVGDAAAAASAVASASASAASAAASAELASDKAFDASVFADAAAAEAVQAFNSAAAAANAATSSATSASTAAASAGDAATSATNAANSAINSAASANAAEAAAQASGNIVFYDTKAAADAGLAGLPNGQIVEVLADETKGGQVTRYKKNVSVYAFQRYMPMFQTVYCNSYAADDSGDGSTPATAKKTLQGLMSILSSRTTDIRLARGSIWYAESLAVPDFYASPYASVTPYGQGNQPIIDAAKTFTAGAWTQPDSVTYPNVWYQQIVFPAAINNAGSNIWQPAVYDEASSDRVPEVGLTRRFTGGSIAANIAAVNANPNSFCCNLLGSTVSNPQTSGLTGTTWEFYISTRDGTDPNTNSRSIRTVDQRGTCYFGPAQNVSDLHFRRCGNKDAVLMSAFAVGTPTIGSVTDCLLEEAGIHGFLTNGANMTRCRVYAAYHGGPLAYAGGGIHQFRPVSTIGASRGFLVKDCYVKGFSIALYSHGAGSAPAGSDYPGTVWEHQTFDADGLISVDCTTVIDTGNSLRQARFRRIKAVGCASIASAPTSTKFEDCEFYWKSNGNFNQPLFPTFGAGRLVTMTNCFVYATGTAVLFGDYDGGATIANYPTLNLINSTFYLGAVSGSTVRSKVNLNLTNSYFGKAVAATNGSIYTGTVTADATSVIEISNTTAARLAAAHPGVSTSVWTGVNQQQVTHTVVASDLSYINIAGTCAFDLATGDNGNGTANITVTNPGAWGGDPEGSRGIRIVNPYGTGVDYVGRMLSQGTGSPLTISPVPTASFTGKTYGKAYFNKKLFDTSVQCFIAEDGLSFRTTDTFFTTTYGVGTVVYVGGVGPNAQTFVPRTITAVNLATSVFTLSSAVPWKTSFDFGVYNPVDGSSSNKMPLPLVTVKFGFPFCSVTSTRPEFLVTKVEGGTFGANGSIPAFVTGERYSGIRDTAGVTFPSYFSGFSYTRGVDYEAGTINNGFGLTVGDILDIKFDVNVVDTTLAGNLANNPAFEYQYALKPGSLFASRGVGYRKILQ